MVISCFVEMNDNSLMGGNEISLHCKFMLKSNPLKAHIVFFIWPNRFDVDSCVERNTLDPVPFS